MQRLGKPLRCRGEPVQQTDGPGRTNVPLHTWSGRQELRLEDFAHVAVLPTRLGSKQAPARSIAQATFSRRSATERRARAWP